KQRAMIIVGAALGRDVDLGRFTSELRGINSGLYLELVQRVNGREKGISNKIDVCIGDAVQAEVGEGAAHAGDRKRYPGTITTAPRSRLAAIRDLARSDIGAEGNEREEVAPVDGEVHDAAVFDYRAHAGVLRVQKRRLCGNLSNFGHGTDVQAEINTRRLLHL